MNSCEPISMTGTPASLWKCGTIWSDIVTHPGVAMAADTITTDAAFLRRRGPYWRVQMIASPAEPKVRNAPCSFAHANSTQSCGLREALLSSGTLCRNSGILCLWIRAIAAKDEASGANDLRTVQVSHEVAANQHSVDRYRGMRLPARAGSAARPGGRRDSRGPGRSGSAVRVEARCGSATKRAADCAKHRGRARIGRCRSRQQLRRAR